MLTIGKIKPLSPLRSSDRRKIADQIVANFNVEVPSEGDDGKNEDEQASAALGLGAVRNSLLPESSLSARFTTTAGPNLSPVSGTVYVGAHAGEEQRVLWFKIEEKLIPTGRPFDRYCLEFRAYLLLIVYTLWKHPRLVPLLHTPDFVLQKLRGGADLMTPGLAHGPPFPARATKDSIVAVASLEKPSVPMVVGVCVIDVASLKQVQGAKGHAVRGEHWDGDEIWAWSHSGKPGGNAPDHIDGWYTDDPELLNQGMDNFSIDDPEDEAKGGVPLESGDAQPSTSGTYNRFVTGEDSLPYEDAPVEDKELSTKGNDTTPKFDTKRQLNEYCRDRRRVPQRFSLRNARSSKQTQK